MESAALRLEQTTRLELVENERESLCESLAMGIASTAMKVIYGVHDSVMNSKRSICLKLFTVILLNVATLIIVPLAAAETLARLVMTFTLGLLLGLFCDWAIFKTGLMTTVLAAIHIVLPLRAIFVMDTHFSSTRRVNLSSL